ncbi:MAG: hypothetical protein JWL77_2042 [Chthonomonadaceae bacterium]|nr:hypothetical protein [Chthonomonadaceae bacterium]
MPSKKPDCKPIPIELDYTQHSDLMLLAVCNSAEDIIGLISNTRSWLGNVFLTGPNPTDRQLKGLLGRDFHLVTVEFVYPVKTDVAGDVTVQLVKGTNVITVRTFAVSRVVDAQTIDTTKPIDVTLFRANEKDTRGLAYCHHPVDPEPTIQKVLQAVADIVLAPGDHLIKMNKQEKKVQKVPKSGIIVGAPRTDVPVCFEIKQHGSKAAIKKGTASSELRFICQCHIYKEGDERLTDSTLLPCIKPSGTYTEDAAGSVIFSIDTITFVDYASDPNP